MLNKCINVFHSKKNIITNNLKPLTVYIQCVQENATFRMFPVIVIPIPIYLGIKKS